MNSKGPCEDGLGPRLRVEDGVEEARQIKSDLILALTRVPSASEFARDAGTGGATG